MISHVAPASPPQEDLAEAFTPPSDQPDQPIPSSPCGRPRALNLECKKLVVQLLTKGFTLTEAAAFMACDRDTILNERKRDPLFDRNVRRAKAMRSMSPMEVIRQAARTSWRAAAWLIEHRQKAEQEARKIRRQASPRREQASAATSAPGQRAPEPAAASFSAPTPVSAPLSPSAAPRSAAETVTAEGVTTNEHKAVFRRRVRLNRRRLAGRRTGNPPKRKATRKGARARRVTAPSEKAPGLSPGAFPLTTNESLMQVP